MATVMMCGNPQTEYLPMKQNMDNFVSLCSTYTGVEVHEKEVRGLQNELKQLRDARLAENMVWEASSVSITGSNVLKLPLFGIVASRGFKLKWDLSGDSVDYIDMIIENDGIALLYSDDDDSSSSHRTGSMIVERVDELSMAINLTNTSRWSTTQLKYSFSVCYDETRSVDTERESEIMNTLAIATRKNSNKQEMSRLTSEISLHLTHLSSVQKQIETNGMNSTLQAQVLDLIDQLDTNAKSISTKTTVIFEESTQLPSSDDLRIVLPSKCLRLTWDYKVSSGEIGFLIAVRLPDTTMLRKSVYSKNKNGKGVMILDCKVDEELVVLFDNSFSWFGSKELNYNLLVEELETSQKLSSGVSSTSSVISLESIELDFNLALATLEKAVTLYSDCLRN